MANKWFSYQSRTETRWGRLGNWRAAESSLWACFFVHLSNDANHCIDSLNSKTLGWLSPAFISRYRSGSKTLSTFKMKMLHVMLFSPAFPGSSFSCAFSNALEVPFMTLYTCDAREVINHAAFHAVLYASVFPYREFVQFNISKERLYQEFLKGTVVSWKLVSIVLNISGKLGSFLRG